MKHLFLLAVAALMLSLPTGSAQAAGERRIFRPAGNGNGPVQRVMELERRKNAWLRQTFLGR